MHPEGEEVNETEEARVRRYVEALPDEWSASTYEDAARAVIAIANEEQAALRADRNVAYGMLTSAQHRAEAAEAEVERLTRECLDREATETDARERLRRCEERLAAVGDLIMDLGADLSGAQAKVTAVEALADRMDARFDHDYADAIRAALAGAYD